MAIARKRQVSLVDTKYYHCISRCVRRAFLCGEDRFTGQSYKNKQNTHLKFCTFRTRINKTPI